ncbi:hypothetical protein GF386_00175 [Candidatus Pacearchaeota archaeon]|nr:hypothetical protein [Candidatus Pacearchaeota archaeon]MBD3282698.1 hypothetical protein [Candidatus Pacearchaeota archaeon]
MKEKRGQITVFVIIGILVVAVVGGFVFLELNDLNIERINPEVEPVHSFVESCVEEKAKEAVLYTSNRGGYYKIPEPSVQDNFPYYFYNKENYMPSKEKIGSEISRYFNDKLKECMNFESFSGFEINPGEVKSEVSIYDETVAFDVEYPISVTKDKKSYFFKGFQTDVPLRLGVVYNAVEVFIGEQMTHEGICITCLYGIAEDNNFKVNVLYPDYETAIFVFIDENPKSVSEEFSFNFANKYKPKTL